MRFAFAGIDFLGGVFRALLDKGWEPVKLFSRPCDGFYDSNDQTVAWARDARLPIQMTRITPGDLASLKRRGCEALIVAGYPWLIKGWEAHLSYGINFHPSPLPEGRGPYPLFQAILDQRTTWGVTAHALSPRFDEGAIVAQELFPLGPEETHDTLLHHCQVAAVRVAQALADDLAPLWEAARPQREGSYWPRITAAQRSIDWSRGVDHILRTVRAFGSIEAIAQVESRYLYLWAATGQHITHRLSPGTLVSRQSDSLTVAASDGYVRITGWSYQPTGNRRRRGV
jgi:methionyl-tRNA formyltransferase